MIKRDVLIIGGGASGLACAIEVLKAGLTATIIEKNSRLGGVLALQALPFYGIASHYAMERGEGIVNRMVEEMMTYKDQVDIITSSEAIAINENRTVIVKQGQKRMVFQGQAVVLASGVIEDERTIKNHQLSGVYTCLEMQKRLMEKISDSRKKVVIVGTDQHALTVAFQMQQAHYEIEAILEEESSIQGYVVQASKLSKLGCTFLTHTKVKRVEEDGQLIKLVCVDVDEKGQEGRAFDIACELVVISPAYLPREHLLSSDVFKKEKRENYTSIVKLNQHYETSVHGIYVCGDVAGMDGVSTAFIKGQLCGIAIAKQHGCESAEQCQSEVSLNRLLNIIKQARKDNNYHV